MKWLAVMERDLRRLARNPLTILSIVVLPLAYLLILGNALQGPVHDLKLGLVVHDAGPEARELVSALQAIERGPRTFRIVPLDDEREGMRRLRNGELSGLLVVPDRFSRDLEQGLVASAGLFVDNADSVASNALVVATQSALPSLQQPFARLEVRNGPPEIRPQEIYPRVDYDASLIPGVVVMAIFMGSMISGGFNLVLDRFMGIHEGYLSTPLRRIDITLGALASGVIVSVVSSLIVLAIGLLITGARVHGGVAGGLAVVGVAFLASLGLLAMMTAIMGRANHPRFVGVVGGFLNVILFFPSGALYPIASFPRWLRAFAVVDPETYAIQAFKGLLFRGANLAAISGSVLILALFAVGMVTVTILTLKRTL